MGRKLVGTALAKVAEVFFVASTLISQNSSKCYNINMSKEYFCSVCNKKFSSPSALGGHKGSHNRSKNKESYLASLIDVPCRVCSKIMVQPPWNGRVFCSVACRGKYQTLVSRERLVYGVRRKDMENYQQEHRSCEICGNSEVTIRRVNKQADRLARDHNHKTGKFRGLLCYSCNVKLGWYEKLSTEIVQYLAKNNDFNNVKKKMGL